MTASDPKVVIDLDGTLTCGDSDTPYPDQKPRLDVIKALKDYRQRGFKIVIFSARNMRTFEGNIGKINVHTLPVVIEWLGHHGIPYDEIILGKPWCGPGGLYVDDRAIRPDEFAQMSYEEVQRLISGEAYQ